MQNLCLLSVLAIRRYPRRILSVATVSRPPHPKAEPTRANIFCRPPALPSILRAGETLLVLLLLVGFCCNTLRPAWRALHTDFPNYYLAARLYREGYPLRRLYDWPWLQYQKHRFDIDRPIVGFIPLTPFSLFPLVPLTGMPPLAAKHFWLVLNLALLALEWRLLTHMTRLGGRRVLLIVLLAILPLHTNFLYGQYYVLLLVLFTVAAMLYVRGRDISAGAVLAFAAGLKVFPAFFVLFFIRKRSWRALQGFVAGFLGVALLSIGLLGWQVNRVYLFEILPRALRGESHDPYSLGWNTVTALLHRLLIAEPDLNPHPLMHWPLLYAALQPLWQTFVLLATLYLIAGSRQDERRELLQWGVFSCMLLVLSSETATYHLCVLILAAVLSMDFLIQSGRRWFAAWLLVVYGMLSYPFQTQANAEGWQSLLAVPRMWLLLALWLIMLFALALSSNRIRRHWREPLAFAVAFVVIAGASITVTLRGFRGQFDSYALRLPSLPSSFRSASPSNTGNATIFSVMLGDGYRIARLKGGSTKVLSLTPDVFNPSADPRLPVTWLDGWHTGSDGPQVFALQPDGTPIIGSVIADAWAPAVSANGHYVAFIRERQGRGTLWMKHIGPASVPDGGEQQETSPELDVWDAAFTPAGELVISAARGGAPALFLVHPGARPILSTLPLPQPARYPAASPDGQWLAFSHLEAGIWHLWLADTRHWSVRRLTTGNCNAITPAWDVGSHQLTFASDCGRGLELTALCRMPIRPLHP